MKYLLILLLVSCQIVVKHKGLDNVVPKKIETESKFSPDFEVVRNYCTGYVDHQIAISLKEDENFYISEEDRQFNIDDCYYNFDLNNLDMLEN